MADPQHTASHEPSPRDAAAQEAIQNYRAEDLPRIKARADKWIAGFAALSGVLTTAAVIKGPDTLTKVSSKNFLSTLSPQDLVVIALVAGGIGLALGIYKGYRAANGSPLFVNDIDQAADAEPGEIAGLGDRWAEAIERTARDSTAALRFAAIATVVGIALLAGGLIYASYHPADTSSARTCIQSGDTVTALAGSLPEVKSGSVTVVACPK